MSVQRRVTGDDPAAPRGTVRDFCSPGEYEWGPRDEGARQMPTPPLEMTTVELLRVLVRSREFPREYVEASMAVLADRLDGVSNATAVDLTGTDRSPARPDPTVIMPPDRRSSAAVRSATRAAQDLRESA